MAHFKCVTCRTRLHTPDSPGHLFDEMCPDCGSALERAGDLAELVGFRAITSHDRVAERWSDIAAAEAVALPRPETTC
jgi:hypothetical protein